MDIEFDEEKRRQTLEHRGLDFADAASVFDGPELTPPTIARTMEKIAFRQSAD